METLMPSGESVEEFFRKNLEISAGKISFVRMLIFYSAVGLEKCKKILRKCENHRRKIILKIKFWQ